VLLVGCSSRAEIPHRRKGESCAKYRDQERVVQEQRCHGPQCKHKEGDTFHEGKAAFPPRSRKELFDFQRLPVKKALCRFSQHHVHIILEAAFPCTCKHMQEIVETDGEQGK
jgi:hypothetical protein